MEQVELCLDGPAMAGKVVPIEKKGFVIKMFAQSIKCNSAQILFKNIYD